jgi:hypothetical protein
MTRAQGPPTWPYQQGMHVQLFLTRVRDPGCIADPVCSSGFLQLVQRSLHVSGKHTSFNAPVVGPAPGSRLKCHDIILTPEQWVAAPVMHVPRLQIIYCAILRLVMCRVHLR